MRVMLRALLLLLSLAVATCGAAAVSDGGLQRKYLDTSEDLVIKAEVERGGVYRAEALAGQDEAKAEALLARAKSIAGKIQVLRASAKVERARQREGKREKEQQFARVEKRRQLQAADAAAARRREARARAMQWAKEDVANHLDGQSDGDGRRGGSAKRRERHVGGWGRWGEKMLDRDERDADDAGIISLPAHWFE